MNIQPKAVWNYFEQINAIPRASKKEEQITAFMSKFGNSLGLETIVDEVGNVLIKKPASIGMEDRQKVVLQSHLDMVHQKNSDTDFDFATQGIEMFIDGDWVKAKGTTLGADNGLGVASIMAILASHEISHPPLEALFTIDEETGMTGAKALQPGFLSGSILLNLDTEEDNELTIGCAGGIDVSAAGTYLEVNAEGHPYSIKITGLTGGHSGADIHLGRGNANKLMNRLLLKLFKDHDAGISSFSGGGLRNAIPREAIAVVMVPESPEEKLQEVIAAIKNEHIKTDPELEIIIEESEIPESMAAHEDALKFLRALYSAPNGIYRMTPGFEHLVQTSNNIAKVDFANGSWQVQCLTRSSVESEKFEMVNTLKAAFELAEGTVNTSSSYPGWEPRPDSPVIKMIEETYQKLFGEQLHVDAIHAGLECGIIGAHYPNMQMVSFGPTIQGAHSPDEKASVSSMQKFWKLLLAVLENIPASK